MTKTFILSFSFWLIGSFCILSTAARAEGIEIVRLGVFSDNPDKPDNPGTTVKMYQKFQQYLVEKLSEKALVADDFFIASSEAEMASAIRENKVNMLMATLAMTIAVKKYSGVVDPGLVVWRNGKRQYHTVFFTRKDNPVQMLENLKGKKIAFEKPLSTSAFYLPLSTLQEHNLVCIDDADRRSVANSVRYVFSGTELNQAYWVHSGKVDVAAFSNEDWDKIPENIRKDLHIIYKTSPVMRWVFSFHKGMEPELRRTITEILTKMHKDPDAKTALMDAKRIARIEKFNEKDEVNYIHWEKQLKQLVQFK